MRTGENVVRTIGASAGATVGAGALGSLCAGSLVAAPAAPLCGAAGGLVGGVIGDKIAAGAYVGGREVYHHVLKPAAHLVQEGAEAFSHGAAAQAALGPGLPFP